MLVRNIYIASPCFGSFDMLSNMGLTGMVEKVPVTATFGLLIYTGPAFEPSAGRNVGGVSLRSLNLKLANPQKTQLELNPS